MIARLHYITMDVPGVSHAQLAESACLGGAGWVQLRVKGRATGEWLQIARETRGVCDRHGARLIVNDSVEVAEASGADGVHLGREDMAPAEARRILGAGRIIGGTANTIEDIARVVEQGVDYVGLGPFRFTSTKAKLSPVLGLEGIRGIVDHLRQHGIDIPVIAIGGIRADDVEGLLRAGVHGVAVSSEISLSDDPAGQTRRFVNLCEELTWKH
jgi:thiamine-phosphate pyrophosphorylase